MNEPPQRNAKSPRSAYAGKLAAFAEFAFEGDAAFKHQGRWHDFFRRRIGPTYDGKLIFEIGCFDAAYLCAIAATHPNTAFVGLDWKYKAVHDGARRVVETGLHNVALIRGRAQDLGRMFGEREVDEIWVFHPDPCDRAVERSNRLIAEPFLIEAHRILRGVDSALCIKTDHPGYYQCVLGLLGLPEPATFGAARRDPKAARSIKPFVRVKDLFPPADVPPPSDAAIKLFEVPVQSANFWNDSGAQHNVAHRAFAGTYTLFESRFVNKKMPIYYVELRRHGRATAFSSYPLSRYAGRGLG